MEEEELSARLFSCIVPPLFHLPLFDTQIFRCLYRSWSGLYAGRSAPLAGNDPPCKKSEVKGLNRRREYEFVYPITQPAYFVVKLYDYVYKRRRNAKMNKKSY